jgi:hypothetical protein
LILDVDLEGLEPLETSTTIKDGHAPHLKKLGKFEIFNVN